MNKNCRACLSSHLVEFFDLGPMPLAGGFLAGENDTKEEKLFPLKVHVCQDCGLVQIIDPVDPDILFRDYSFSASTVKPLVDHFDAYAEWLLANLRPAQVVEFGSNDGVLLAPLEKRGVKAIGVDISHNISEIARCKGLNAITGHFDKETATLILNEFGPADVVTGSNAFPHNEHPEYILDGANIVLKDKGYLCLEVMYAGDLLELLQWDTLYHEHLTFYSLETLSLLLKRYGFYVFIAERLPMHGGALRVCACRDPKEPVRRGIDEIKAYEEKVGLNKPETWKHFAAMSNQKIRIVKEVFGQLSKENNIWAYGAAGKATFWVNACNMTYLGGVVDASPLRAGKLMPGTHTPIFFPDELKKQKPDYILVTAWNYAEGIKSKEGWYEGIWSVPLPELRFF